MSETTTTKNLTIVMLETDGNTVALAFDYVPEASLRQLVKSATNIRRVSYEIDGMNVTIGKPAASN